MTKPSDHGQAVVAIERKPGWLSFDPTAVRMAAMLSPDQHAWRMQRSDAHAAASAFQTAARSKPSQCVYPISWRKGADGFDLMVLDDRGRYIHGTLRPVRFGDVTKHIFEIIGGPFDRDPDGNQVDLRDLAWERVKRVSSGTMMWRAEAA